MRKALISGLFLVSLLSCRLDDLLFAPSIPMDAYQIEPLPEYSEYWSEMEECTDKTRDMNEVSWWLVPRSSFKPNLAYCDANKRDGCSGWYDSYRSRIYLMEFAVRDRPIITQGIKYALGLNPRDSAFRDCN
jgi:hypothetical protein